MKNLFKPFIVLSFFIQTLKAQTNSQKVINKGDVTATAYFGFPNRLPTALKSAYKLNDHTNDQLDIKNSVPLGLTISYFVNSALAIGGEISYERTQIKWRENETMMGNDSTIISYSHHYTLNASKVRLLIILNYHFAIREHSDLYFGFGLGYSHSKTNLDIEFPHTSSYSNVPPCFFPVSTRTKVGVNYYLTKKVAINAEIGIGGPLLSMGITGNF